MLPIYLRESLSPIFFGRGYNIFMQSIFRSAAFTLVVGLLFSFAAVSVDAQRANTREVRDTVRSLNTKIQDLDQTLRYQLRSSSAGRTAINEGTRVVNGLKAGLKDFEDNLAQRRESSNDIDVLVDAARAVDGFLMQYPQNRTVTDNWSEIRVLIGRLSANYGVIPSWDDNDGNASSDSGPTTYQYPTNDRGSAPVGGLNGTYRIDRDRSESVADIIADISVSGSQKQDLESKLDAPEEIAISVRGQNVTLASSNASPITFAADGTERSEQSNGRNIRVRATLRGDRLTVVSLGGETDYTINFEPDGDGIKVTRRITTAYLRETVFAESFYEKTDSIARLGIDDGDDETAYSSNDPDDNSGSNSPNPTLSMPRLGKFVVPNGAVLSGTLENEIDTKISQNNDRFKMKVQSPNEFRGAVVEGYISGVGRSGQVSGRSNITFNFERITLASGDAYDFAGSLRSIKDQNGKEVKIDAEGTAKGSSQTKETAKRGGIGAGIGAVIGAIAGGGKGAVLGAIIGGGAGAGSVAITGRDDIKLLSGSTMTVESSSPIRTSEQPNDN